MTYRCTFDRVGRKHDLAPLDIPDHPDATPDDLAEVVYRYVRPHLGSRDVEVDVDLEDMTGTIFCGGNVGGQFTISELGEEVASHGR